MNVALVQDRPVYGGNASSEVRVHTLGLPGRRKDILSQIDTGHYPNGSPKAKKAEKKRHRAIDDAMADRLAALGLRYVGISIDGIATRHDKLRGQRGAHEGAVAAIDRCDQRGIKVGVRFTAHGLNHEDLDTVFDLCTEHGVDRLCIYHLAYAGRGGGCARSISLRPRRAAW